MSTSSQSYSISSALSEFYKQKSVSIDGSGSDRSFDAIKDSLAYDELLNRASLDYTGAADPSTAAAVEQTHEAVAAIRENEMVSKSRLDLYTDMASEYSLDSEYHSDRSVFMTALLNRETRVPYLG